MLGFALRFASHVSGAYSGPSLALEFDTDSYKMGAIGKQPASYAATDLITFTRASGGGRINSLGQFEWVGTNVPRLTYDPVTLQPLGLLIEAQRTNLLMRSTLEGGTAGTIGSGAVAPTGWLFGAPAPAGDVSYPATSFGTIGVRFQAVAQRPTIRQIFAAAANLPYCLSGRITSLTGSLTIQDVVQYANVPAGATTTWLKNGVAVANTAPVAVGDHVAAVLTVAATAGNADARFGPGGSSNVTCDCTMTMPQVEQASAPSTYIPTTTAQVTRAADVVSVNTLSPWFNQLEGTIVVKAISSPSQPAPISETYAALRGASINYRIEIAKATAQTYLAGAVVREGALQVNLNGATLPPNTAFGAAISYRDDSFAFSLNGGTVVTDKSGLVPVVTVLNIGSRSSANQCNGIISSITYYPRVIDVQQASA